MNESYARRGYAGRGYARRRQDETRTGGVIIAVLALLSAFLVILGLVYAAGAGERHKAALAAAGCEPNLLSINVGCTTVFMIHAKYLAMVNPIMQQLNADAAGYLANETHRLAAAETELSAEVTVENELAKSLARFPFSPTVAPAASTVIKADDALAAVTARQAKSASLVQMRSFNAQADAAAATLQKDMSLLLTAVDAHPTAAQEP